MKITRKTPPVANTKGVKLNVPLKYLSNFWRTVKMPTKTVTSQRVELLNFLGLLMKTGLPLMKNVIKTLAKLILLPLVLTKTPGNKIFGSRTTTFIFSNEELNGILNIAKSLEDFNLLIKGIPETDENEVKEQKGGFLGMFCKYIQHQFFRKC